jgi:hypothetical protein
MTVVTLHVSVPSMKLTMESGNMYLRRSLSKLCALPYNNHFTRRILRFTGPVLYYVLAGNSFIVTLTDHGSFDQRQAQTGRYCIARPRFSAAEDLAAALLFWFLPYGTKRHATEMEFEDQSPRAAEDGASHRSWTCTHRYSKWPRADTRSANTNPTDQHSNAF